jgi:hypothetical protein
MAHTLGDMAKALNRSALYLAGLQKRFELPVFGGAAYPDAYLAFLRAVVALRTFNIAEETLCKLWNFEKKLLRLLHADTTGSATWFLDACGAATHPKQRLLLTNYDLGVPVPSKELQLGLNFADKQLPELFGVAEMGEDALRVLNEIIALHARIRADLRAELPRVLKAAQWAARLAR